MNQFIKNLIKGGASINLTPNNSSLEESLKQIDSDIKNAQIRAFEKSLSVEQVIRKDFFEIMLGQLFVFTGVIFFLVLTIWMAMIKVPDIYCFLTALIAHIIFFGPKVAEYYLKIKNNDVTS